MCAHTEEYHKRFGLCEEAFSDMTASQVNALEAAICDEDKAQLDRIEAKIDEILKRSR